ncbi:unnamed protein product [Arabidopsis halleri]
MQQTIFLFLFFKLNKTETELVQKLMQKINETIEPGKGRANQCSDTR